VQWVFWLNSDGSVTTYAAGSGSKKYGLVMFNPTYGKYIYFWHMANNTTTQSYVATYIAPGLNVVEGTALGYQGDATGVFNTCVHLHFTVSTSGTGDFLWPAGGTCNCLDPSSYVGYNLNNDNPSHVPANGTYLIQYDGQPPSTP
jgi:hypothetical protein